MENTFHCATGYSLWVNDDVLSHGSSVAFVQFALCIRHATAHTVYSIQSQMVGVSPFILQFPAVCWRLAAYAGVNCSCCSVIILAKRILMFNISCDNYWPDLLIVFQNLCHLFFCCCWQEVLSVLPAGINAHLPSFCCVCPVHKCSGSLPFNVLLAHWPWVTLLMKSFRKKAKYKHVLFLDIKVNVMGSISDPVCTLCT